VRCGLLPKGEKFSWLEIWADCSIAGTRLGKTLANAHGGVPPHWLIDDGLKMSGLVFGVRVEGPSNAKTPRGMA
jgi:hypothetical protein